MAPDEDMIKLGYFVARGEYEKNKFVIHYGIPTDKEIEEYNSRIGKLYPSSKDCGKLFCDPDYTKLVTNDDPRLFRPDKKTYMTYKPIIKAFENFKYYDDTSKTYSSWNEYYVAVSKKTGYRVEDVKNAVIFMKKYYPYMSYGRDEEGIEIQL